MWTCAEEESRRRTRSSVCTFSNFDLVYKRRDELREFPIFLSQKCSREERNRVKTHLGVHIETSETTFTQLLSTLITITAIREALFF
jgi:hypothetical protein